jgi:predicted RNase H-like nuclease (RuvC/YqgF family)
MPDNATEEQKAEIARHNEFNAQLRSRLKKDPTNAKEYGELKLEAAESHHLRRTLGEYESKIAALEAQLAKSKNALRTTPKGGSLLKSDTAPKEKGGLDLGKNESPQERLRMRLRQSMGAGANAED